MKLSFWEFRVKLWTCLPAVVNASKIGGARDVRCFDLKNERIGTIWAFRGLGFRLVALGPEVRRNTLCRAHGLGCFLAYAVLSSQGGKYPFIQEYLDP